jgi:hypothetical protein
VSVGLLLTATGSGDLREPIEAWLISYVEEDAECQLESTADQLLLSVHPAADPVELSFVERGTVIVTATTSTAGAGYHIFVCDLLQRMGEETGLAWHEANDDTCLDDTGYFHSGDRTAPARKMAEWVATLAPEDLKMLPLGPRSEPSTAMFPWAGEERDAVYHLNRGLTLMWQSVRWRAPLTDEERATNEAVLYHLNTAYALDPSLEYPAAEWHELAGYMETEAPVPAAEPGAEPIGYLRKWLRVHVRSGWMASIPGSFAYAFEGATWTAFDAETTVEITLFPFDKKTAEQILGEAFQRERDEALEVGPHDRRATTEFIEEDECFALNGLIAIAERLCVVNIYFADEELRAQALAIWESIEAVES